MTDSQRQKLLDTALAARSAAYAPYSKFHVGSAVLAANGDVYTGVNVENASYGLTICAERVAVTTAIAAGSRDLVAVAVATPGGHAPCGACRQVLAEFGSQMQVLLVDTDQPGHVQDFTLDQLLPGQFRLDK